jgi:hypothetical protein
MSLISGGGDKKGQSNGKGFTAEGAEEGAEDAGGGCGWKTGLPRSRCPEGVIAKGATARARAKAKANAKCAKEKRKVREGVRGGALAFGSGAAEGERTGWLWRRNGLAEEQMRQSAGIDYGSAAVL